MVAGRRHCIFALLLLCSSLARLSSCEQSQDGTAPETAETTEASREENGGETLSDDEDFTAKVPITFYATSTYSCDLWQEVDRIGSSQTIINKMLLYVDSVCDCGFDNRYLTPLKVRCDARVGTLLVSTNMSLPFNHQRPQLIVLLKNWLKTEPNFAKTINGGRTVVSVVDFETTHTVYPSPSPPLESGDGSDDDNEVMNTTDIIPTTTEDPDGEGDVGSGSGNNKDNTFESSSPIVAMDFGVIFLTCAAVLTLYLS